MAINVNSVSEKIYNLIKGFGHEVQSYDNEGNLVVDPIEGTRFAVKEPNILVRFDKKNQQVLLSANKDSDVSELREMLKDMALDNLQDFDFKLFDKHLEPKSEKVDIAQNQEKDMADVMEGFGPMTGSSKTSYQPLDSVKLVVRHKKPVNEEVRGSRSRNIHSIYIQRGHERFKMAENNLRAARAMARHIQQGGEMYDAIGSAITESAIEQRKLREFVRYVSNAKLVNEENESYVKLAIENINSISETLHKLIGIKSYANACEDIVARNSVEVLTDDVDLQSKFTETHFDDRVANAIDSIKTAMSRQASFESKINDAIANESFDNLKDLVTETNGLDFTSPHAKLGYQVAQMGNTAKDPMLSNYLSGISKKISGGSNLNQFEYSTIKSCLLSANEPRVRNEAVDHSKIYESFLDSFIIED